MNEKLNIQNLIDLLAEKHGIASKDAEDFVKTFFALIEEGLEQDRYVKIKGLGTFKLIGVESRGSVDVNTGERIEIQGHTKVSFTPDPTLKEIINRPFGLFETVILNENTVLEDTPVEKEGEEEVEDHATLQNVEENPESAADGLLETEPAFAEPEQAGEIVVDANGEQKDVQKECAELVKEQKEVSLEIEGGPMLTDGQERGGRMKWILVALFCVLLACAGVVCYLYFPGMQKPTPTLPTGLQQSSLTENPVKDVAQVPDSLSEKEKVNEVETREIVEKSAAEKEEAEVETTYKTVKKKSAKKVQPVIPDSVNYEITGTMATYTVKEGETLTRVSLRFYGTKALWPYIVKHNMNVLKDPNNVTSGTVLRIPKLVKKQ